LVFIIKAFEETKESLIKVIDIDKETNIAYLINTLLKIINRWNKIRVYIYDIKESEK
jgi:hypothetical protein